MSSGPPTDQELVVHLFAPQSGPRVAAAHGHLRAIWQRCRELLGASRAIAGTDLPTTLPADLCGTGSDAAVAAMENSTADIQVILREAHDVLNLSLVFASPVDSSARRVRIGSAVPPGWIEFDRWWTEVAGDDVTALLGMARVYQAGRSRESALGSTDPIRSLLPVELRDGLEWSEGGRIGEFEVWEPAVASAADRRLVVLAPAGREEQLSAWTWSRGDVAMPPLARYLMHAAKLRYEIRVWLDGQHDLDTLLSRIDAHVNRLRGDLGQPSVVDELRTDEAELLVATTELRRLRQAAEIARANMSAVLAEPLLGDRGLGDWFDRQLEHTLTRLDDNRWLAKEIRELTPPGSTTTRPDNATRSARPGKPIRMGFMLDVVGYGRRTTPAKEQLQERVASLVRDVLDDLGLDLADTDRQGTGDGLVVFLPEKADVQHALPRLLRSMWDRLSRDNANYRDRMRLRMAVDVGPVGLAALGFGGGVVVSTGRMLDSASLRRHITDHPHLDLAVLVSDRLHSFVVAEGIPGLDPARFERTRVKHKELVTDAWLWTGS